MSDEVIRDALRLAKRPMKPQRFHQTLARTGYNAGGGPDIEGDVQFAPPQEPAPVQQPVEESKEAFLKEQLKGSAPQYDPEAGAHTLKEAALMGAGMVPGAGIAAASGNFPTAEGGMEPSLREDWQAGNYGSAALKGLGAAGDVVSAVPVVGTAAGAAMKAPLAAKLAASAMAVAPKLAREAEVAAPVAEAAAPVYKRLVNPAGFYSRAHEVAMNELPEGERTWQEMQSLLNKAPGMRKEELYWSGLHPEAFEPGAKVTREQLAEMIEKNFPQVSPIIQGGTNTAREKAADEFHRAYYEHATGLNSSVTPEIALDESKRLLNTFDSLEGPEGVRSHFGEKYPELREAAEAYVASRPKATKYEQHVVPGGEDYNERILTHQYGPEAEGPAYTQERYTHGHWPDINNPVVHTRNSMRTGPNGEKIWHQEEVQSDWAQQGREQGFKDPKLMKELEDKRLALKKEKDRLDASMDENGETEEAMDRFLALNQEMREVGDKIRNLGQIPPAPYTRDTEHWLELAAKDTLAQAIEAGADKIFITGGQEQAKRWANQLRQAVDNVRWESPNPQKFAEDTKALDELREQVVGTLFDGRSWSELSGQEMLMAQRVLNKKGAAVPFDAPEGSKVVYATPKGGGQPHKFVVKQVEGPNGKPRYEVVDSSIPDAKGETLSAVVGSDLAKRIMAEESGEQAMKGYRMGSEGYSQTYEKKYPSVYKKLIKGLDPEAKVEAGPLISKGAPGAIDFEALNDAIGNLDLPSSDRADLVGEVNSIKSAVSYSNIPVEQAIDRYASLELIDLIRKTATAGVHGTYIHITPKMRAEYMRLKQKHGAVFPAYKRGGAARAASNRDALAVARGA